MGLQGPTKNKGGVLFMNYVIAFHLLTGALVLILSQIDVKEIDE